MIEKYLEILSYEDLISSGYSIIGKQNKIEFMQVIKFCEFYISVKYSIMMIKADYDSFHYFCDVIKIKEG